MKLPTHIVRLFEPTPGVELLGIYELTDTWPVPPEATAAAQSRPPQ